MGNAQMRVGFFKRASMYGFDVLIHLILLFSIVAIFPETLGLAFLEWASVPGDAQSMVDEFASLGGIAALTYYSLWMLIVLPEIVYALSPGKYLVGAEIRSQDGKEASGAQLTLRFFVKNAFQIFFFLNAILATAFDVNRPIVMSLLVLLLFAAICLGLFSGVGCFLAIFPGRRALHDYIAGTAVFPRSRSSKALQYGVLKELGLTLGGFALLIGSFSGMSYRVGSLVDEFSASTRKEASSSKSVQASTTEAVFAPAARAQMKPRKSSSPLQDLLDDLDS